MAYRHPAPSSEPEQLVEGSSFDDTSDATRTPATPASWARAVEGVQALAGVSRRMAVALAPTIGALQQAVGAACAG